MLFRSKEKAVEPEPFKIPRPLRSPAMAHPRGPGGPSHSVAGSSSSVREERTSTGQRNNPSEDALRETTGETEDVAEDEPHPLLISEPKISTVLWIFRALSLRSE